MKCQACGQDNPDSALFCSACRRPLVAAGPMPTRIQPLSPAMATAATPSDRPSPGANRYAPPESDAAGRSMGDPEILTDDEARAAFIGDSSTGYYLDRFDRLSRGDSGGFNWPAMLVTWYWMLYRKMWIPALIYFFTPYAVAVVLGGFMAVSPALGGVLYLAWLVVWLIGPGLLANGWYYKHAMAKIRNVRLIGGSKAQMLARLEAAGGTSGVVVIGVALLSIFIVGILAAVALPAYQTYTVKAKVADAALEGDEVAQAVGQQFAQTGQYPADIDAIVAKASHQSKYVSRIELDGTTGILTIRVDVPPRISGSILMMADTDSNHHLAWTCSSEDLKKYVPARCRR
jgi:type II secretory pathway pseudopilin PulG